MTAAALLATCRAAGLTIATAESCTGGLVAAALTDIPGCSDVMLGGFVTYSNALKTALLGVPAALIAADGAVSETVAVAMVQGALTASGAGLAVAVTGIAGPGGGSEEKPVGLVWLAAARQGQPVQTRCCRFAGNRAAIRQAATKAALDLLGYCASGGASGGPPGGGPPPG